MRKGNIKKRHLIPDPKYKETLATKFVNCLMKQGKKNLAYSIFYDAVVLVSEKTQEEGLELWKKALMNVTPSVEVKRKRVGGATFQVPIEVRPQRKLSLSIKWLIKYARLRKEKTMKEKLANEIIAAAKGEGSAVKKKDDMHRMASANKAFSHFRF